MSTGQPSPHDPYSSQQGPQGFQPQPQKSNAKLVLLIVAIVGLPILLICGCGLIGLLLPAVQSAREAARRMSCSNNMKQIGLAMHNYHDVHGQFPPAYTVDDTGRRLHSWRTLILPFMDQKPLYDSIDLSKPWDDPVNQQAAHSAVLSYACPSAPGVDPTMTTYLAIADPSSVLGGPNSTRFRDIIDGTSNTVMITETNISQAVPWMSPQDMDLQTFINAAPSGASHHPGGGHVLIADGSVQFLSNDTPEEARRAMVTIAGAD